MDVYNLNRMWGAAAVRGMISILFGVVAVFWPGETLVTLAYLFGSYVVLTGMINLVGGLSGLGAAADSLWARLAVAALGLGETGVGVYLLRHPHVKFSTLVLLIGITLIVRALIDLFAGIFGALTVTHRTVFAVSGLLALATGIIVLLQSEDKGVAFVWVLGLYAILTGPMLVSLAADTRAVGFRGRR